MLITLEKLFPFCEPIGHNVFCKTADPDVIWTRNLLIWSQTRYRCATRPIVCCYTSLKQRHQLQLVSLRIQPKNSNIWEIIPILRTRLPQCLVQICWPWRDLNTQPSDLESDAQPLRHKADCLLLYKLETTASVTASEPQNTAKK